MYYPIIFTHNICRQLFIILSNWKNIWWSKFIPNRKKYVHGVVFKSRFEKHYQMRSWFLENSRFMITPSNLYHKIQAVHFCWNELDLMYYSDVKGSQIIGGSSVFSTTGSFRYVTVLQPLEYVPSISVMWQSFPWTGAPSVVWHIERFVLSWGHQNVNISICNHFGHNFAHLCYTCDRGLKNHHSDCWCPKNITALGHRRAQCWQS